MNALPPDGEVPAIAMAKRDGDITHWDAGAEALGLETGPCGAEQPFGPVLP